MTIIIKGVNYMLPHGRPCAAFAGSSTVDPQNLAAGCGDSCINTAAVTTAAVTTADAANAMCQHKRTYKIQ